MSALLDKIEDNQVKVTVDGDSCEVGGESCEELSRVVSNMEKYSADASMDCLVDETGEGVGIIQKVCLAVTEDEPTGAIDHGSLLEMPQNRI